MLCQKTSRPIAVGRLYVGRIGRRSKARGQSVRPFAPEKVNIISVEQMEQNVGKIIDALFDEMPGGGPPK